MIEPTESVAELFAANPELAAKYEVFEQTLADDAALGARHRAMCRLRIAAIHSCQEEWQARPEGEVLTDAELDALSRGDSTAFANADQAVLTVAEAIPYDHHGLTDEQIAEVRSHLGEAGTVALLTACAFHDVSCRWRLALGPAKQEGDR